MEPKEQPPAPPLETIHECFILLHEGREDEARRHFAPSVFDAASDMLRSHAVLEADSTPRPAQDYELPRVETGTLIDGFDLLELIGEGASGQVYRARQRTPDREVALKLLWPCSHAEAFQQRREASMLAQLEHPGIARLYAVGVWQHARSHRPWMAMELVKDARPLGPSATDGWTIEARVALMASVADALAHAHAKAIIHRDLKADNVLLAKDGTIRIIDFGLARRDGPANERSVALLGDRIVGSLVSMAPECLAPGAVADVRSDVFGLGTILFGTLAGRPMRQLEGRSIAQALRSIDMDPVPRLGVLDRRLKGDLDRIVAKAVHADPSQRYSSMDLLARDLRDHLAGRPVLIDEQHPAERLVRSVRRHWKAWSIAASIAVTLIVAATISARSAMHAREQARLANLSAASSAVDATDQLALDRALAALVDDRSVEADLLRRVASLRGREMARGDWYALAAGPDGSWMVGSVADVSPTGGAVSFLARRDGTTLTWVVPLALATTNGVAISPDGAWIACCHVTEGVSVVDARTGSVHRTWPTQPNGAGSVPIFLKDGSLVILTTHAQRWTIDGHPLSTAIDLGIGAVRATRLRTDGTLLVAGHLGASVVDPNNGRTVQSLSCPASRQSAAWSSVDGMAMIVAGWDRSVRRYDPGSAQPRWTGRLHHDNIWSITELGERRVLTAGADGLLVAWDLESGSSMAIPGSPDIVWSLLRSSDGLWIGSQGGLRLQATDSIDRWIGTPTPRRRVTNAASWSAWITAEGTIDGRRTDGTALGWAPELGRFALLATNPRHDRLCALRHDGTILCIDATNGSTLWESTELISDDAAEVAGIPMLAMQDDLGLLLVASRVHGCAAIRLSDGTVAWTSPLAQQCAAVGAGPEGVILAGGRDGLICRLSADGTVTASTRSQRSRAASLAVDAAGTRVIAGGADGTLRVLDAASLDQRLAIRVSDAALDSLWIDDQGIWTIDRDGILRCR